MELTDGWEAACTPPGACAGPVELNGLGWSPAQVPGTAAGAASAEPGDARDFDAEDWWFRCRFRAPAGTGDGPVTLRCDGIATVSEVYLNGERVLDGESMFEPLEAEVAGGLRDDNELIIACRALGPLLARRRRPAARWRTRVVNASNLRWYRTMVFGRSPGFAAGPATVGPWRPVHLLTGPRIADMDVRPRLSDGDGHVAISARVAGTVAPVTARLAGGEPVTLHAAEDGTVTGELRLASPARWWPHTHGEPALHDLELTCDGVTVARRRVGFRDLACDGDPLAAGGLALRVNGVPVFARGAVWTPPDLVGMAPTAEMLRALLERMRDAGMNMVRIPGTAAYEPAAFHDLCDELGILVWQDLMFACLDYPLDDPGFAAIAESEAARVVHALVGRPSLAVVCGNNEVEQQPAMAGLDPALGRHAFWSQTLPGLLAEARADCVCLPSTPTGGTLPFQPDGGVTHYFGVSGYFMPVVDLRRTRVAFASECLAFANVPDDVEVPVHHPRWKQGVARDAGTGWGIGAGWDFDDVRDHYLGERFGVDPVALRRYDHERYLELGRAATGEVMAEALGEWRREGSGCNGALVLWLKDMVPGAGLGVLDHRGRPKAAYHHLRRAMAPVAVWLTDEGLAGYAVHVVNDRGVALAARLRLSLYRDGQTSVAEAIETLALEPHGRLQRSAEGMLGGFFDLAWAYRFGPPSADQVVAALESLDGGELFAHAVRFPAGHDAAHEPAGRHALTAEVHAGAVTLCSQRLLDGVRLQVAGYEPDDSWFCLEPGRPRRIGLRVPDVPAKITAVAVDALNVSGRIDAVLTEG